MTGKAKRVWLLAVAVPVMGLGAWGATVLFGDLLDASRVARYELKGIVAPAAISILLFGAFAVGSVALILSRSGSARGPDSTPSYFDRYFPVVYGSALGLAVGFFIAGACVSKSDSMLSVIIDESVRDVLSLPGVAIWYLWGAMRILPGGDAVWAMLPWGIVVGWGALGLLCGLLTIGIARKRRQRTEPAVAGRK